VLCCAPFIVKSRKIRKRKADDAKAGIGGDGMTGINIMMLPLILSYFWKHEAMALA